MSILWLSLNTYREMIREKFVMVILGLAIFLIVFSIILGELTFDEAERLMADMGLAAIEIGSIAIALFAGSTLLSREIEKQTCLLILAKPISRKKFLLSKGLGLAILLCVMTITLSFLLYILLAKKELFFPIMIISASILLKSFIILSWTLLMSVWVRPVLSVLWGVTVYFLGHWLSDIAFFAKDAEKDWEHIINLLKWITPNFDTFNWKSHYYLYHPPSLELYTSAAIHGGCWILLLLIVATWSFEGRDIV